MKTYKNFEDFAKDNLQDIKKIEQIKRGGVSHYDACCKVWGLKNLTSKSNGG